MEVPLEVQPASGQISLHFSWESASVVNLVCKDFEVDLEVEGRALRQDHVLRGQIELCAAADVLTATPVVHERAFPLKIELTPASWGKVEAALRAQDTPGRCGMFLDPEACWDDCTSSSRRVSRSDCRAPFFARCGCRRASSRR